MGLWTLRFDRACYRGRANQVQIEGRSVAGSEGGRTEANANARLRGRVEEGGTKLKNWAEIEIPHALTAQLQKEAAGYKGTLAPTYGDMLKEAWGYRELSITLGIAPPPCYEGNAPTDGQLLTEAWFYKQLWGDIHHG